MANKMVTTGYCYDPTMMLHSEVVNDGGPHPEQPARITAIFNAIHGAGLIPRMQKVACRSAAKLEVLLVHSEEHWERIRRIAFFPDEHILATAEYFTRMSLYLNRESSLCARLSCGGVIELCRAVAEGQVRNGFAIVRPPGHHAEPEQEMGFCFFNNVAVAARLIQQLYRPKGIRKILVLDWDVHHGNGTQKAFWTDPDVLYISLHMYQHGSFYPGGLLGNSDQVGEDAGLGKNVNIPWNEPGMGDADYLYAFQNVIMPIAFEFDPDFVIVSAGYDAAEGDDLGTCRVSPAGFAHMTHMLSSLAKGKLVLALEGGYSLEAISSSALECVKVLLGDLPPKLPPMTCSSAATLSVYEVCIEQSRFWKSIKPVTNHARSESDRYAESAPISELLRAHRSYDLYKSCRLANIELVDERLQALFEDQIFCSENVFDADTIVLFMHDIGTIYSEANSREYDLEAEKTFMIRSGRHVVDWASNRGYGMIDVNVTARLPSAILSNTRRSDEKADEISLANHIWDYFLRPASASKVLLVGLASGCAALTHMINERAPALQDKVVASLQITGRQQPPIIVSADKKPGLRSWYSDLSRIICFESLDKSTGERKKWGNLERAQFEDPLRELDQDWFKLMKWLDLKQPQALGSHVWSHVTVLSTTKLYMNLEPVAGPSRLPIENDDDLPEEAYDDSESEDIEVAVLLRDKRIGAGNKLRALLDNEQELEAEELFAEEENDVDFVTKEEADVFDSDFLSTSSGEENLEEDAGEKQLRKEERRRKRAERAKEAARLHKPAFDYEKEALRRKRDRLKSKPNWDTVRERKLRRFSPSYKPEGRERVSSRKTVLDYVQQVEKHLAKDSAKTRARLADERFMAKKDAAKQKRTKVWSQTELVEEALSTEQRNKASLEQFYKTEEARRVMVATMTGYGIYGPRLAFVSTTRGIGRKCDLVREVEPPVKQSLILRLVPSKSADPSSQLTAGLPKEQLAPKSQSPLQPSTQFGPALPMTTAESLPLLSKEPHILAPVHQTATIVRKAKAKEPYAGNFLLSADLDWLDGPLHEEELKAIFGRHCEWTLAESRLPKQEMCPVTGQIARYRDPQTGIPYANKEAFRIVRSLARQDVQTGYIWSPELHCFTRKIAESPVVQSSRQDPQDEEASPDEDDEPISHRGTKRAPYIAYDLPEPKRSKAIPRKAAAAQDTSDEDDSDSDNAEEVIRVSTTRSRSERAVGHSL